MITIILAAGNNKRFGGKHKGALKARDGRTVLENIADNLNAKTLFVVAQKKYRWRLNKAIKNLSAPGSKRISFHAWLQKPTSGPLDTLWQAREWIKILLDAQNNGDCPVVISYCDVLLERVWVSSFLKSCEGHDAGIVVFESDDDRFGNAMPGVTDKIKNSGLFYFRSGKQMLAFLQNTIKGNENLGVPSLVYFCHDPKIFLCNEVIDIGVPEDYEEYIND